MFKRKSKTNVDVARARVAEEAGKLSSKAAKEATVASSRVANQASAASAKMAKEAGVAGARIANQAAGAVERAKTQEAKTKTGVAKLRLRLPSRKRLATDAVLKAQLAKTSRDLRHESTDLKEAVEALNGVIKANRKQAAAGRTRLIFGVAVGAALTYHLDAQQGRERRQATLRRVNGLIGSRG